MPSFSIAQLELLLLALKHSGRRYPLTQFGQDVAVAYRNLTRLVQVSQ